MLLNFNPKFKHEEDTPTSCFSDLKNTKPKPCNFSFKPTPGTELGGLNPKPKTEGKAALELHYSILTSPGPHP